MAFRAWACRRPAGRALPHRARPVLLAARRRRELIYRYPDAKWLDAEGSRLDVSINGQFLKTLPLTGMSWWQKLWYGKGATNATARGSIGLPRYNLFGQNELVFDYSLLMADKKKCTGTLPDNVRVSLDPESTIDLTGAWHGLLMPDLASFAGAGYPSPCAPTCRKRWW
jgi:cellulose synthase (UDP-forming)